MKNKLAYLGLLGFVGILGFLTENRGLIGFFAFFVFFRYFFVRPDELFILNVQRAATPAFFTGVAVQTLTIAVTAFTKDLPQLVKGLAFSFSISIALFIILLSVYEYKENRGK